MDIESKNIPLDSFVSLLFRTSEQNTRFTHLKKLVTVNVFNLTPETLRDWIVAEEGPLFLTSIQANEIKVFLQSKLDLFDVRYHHVMCSRVLDFWNLEKNYGFNTGTIYYQLARISPKLDSIDDFVSDFYGTDCKDALRDDWKDENNRFLQRVLKGHKKRKPSNCLEEIVSDLDMMKIDDDVRKKRTK
jgi:hypothetical protein